MTHWQRISSRRWWLTNHLYKVFYFHKGILNPQATILDHPQDSYNLRAKIIVLMWFSFQEDFHWPFYDNRQKWQSKQQFRPKNLTRYPQQKQEWTNFSLNYNDSEKSNLFVRNSLCYLFPVLLSPFLLLPSDHSRRLFQTVEETCWKSINFSLHQMGISQWKSSTQKENGEIYSSIPLKKFEWHAHNILAYKVKQCLNLQYGVA